MRPTRVERVLALCERTLADLPTGRERDDVQAVSERLRGPLRVAVAGRVKAGKSTLVNALLRQRAAPTAVGDCTKVVTWFRYGPQEEAEVVLRDGASVPVPLVEGALPHSLGVDVAEVDHVAVRLSNTTLGEMTLVDTPGLSAAAGEHSARTEAFLGLDPGSRAAIGQTDVLVFLVSQAAREDDAEALESFTSLLRGSEVSPLTAIGLLSKADKVGNGDRSKAQEVAARLAADLRDHVGTVLPIVGLLAETASAGLFTEHDAEALRRLAALERSERELMLVSADLFLDTDSPVPRSTRRRLLDLLDLYGLAALLDRIDRGVVGATRLRAELLELAGVEELRRVIDETFVADGDALKAAAGLRALERISWRPSESGRPPTLRRLRDGVEELRLADDMHRIRELWALQECSRAGLPDELAAELRRVVVRRSLPERVGLGDGATSEELRQAVLRGAARWTELANTSSVACSRVAEVIARSFRLMWLELRPTPYSEAV